MRIVLYIGKEKVCGGEGEENGNKKAKSSSMVSGP